MPQSLAEKHRPKTLDGIVGQDKAVKLVRLHLERGGFAGRAVYITGASGYGKTTLARIIADTLADRDMVAELDSADDLDADTLERWRQSSGLYGWGKGGRAFIVNEAHGLRAPIIRKLLGWLERLPGHCVVIFTTTNDGESMLFDGIDAKPLVDRCISIRLTNQGTIEPCAELIHRIAQAEGLNGCPDAMKAARRIAMESKSIRAAIDRIESGALLT